jgi:hypothetical protein
VENLAIEIAATGERSYAIGGTVGQRLNGHGGLAPAGSDETVAVAKEQVLYVVWALEIASGPDSARTPKADERLVAAQKLPIGSRLRAVRQLSKSVP